MANDDRVIVDVTERVAALLKKVEWAGGMVCAACGRLYREGHSQDCEMAAMLALLKDDGTK